MNKVVVIGASVIDVILKSSQFKIIKSHQIETGVAMCEVLGGKTEAMEGVVSTGGGGSNVAVGLKRLGEAVKLISKVGNDAFGEVIVKDLDKEMVDRDLLKMARGQTGFSSVLVAGDGSRSITTFRGLSSSIHHEDIDWRIVSHADWVQLSSLGGNLELIKDIVDYCFSKGVRVGINPGRVEIDKGVLEILKNKIDWLCVNRQEASLMSKSDFEDEMEIMKSLASYGIRCITVSDGKRGASLLNNRRWIKMSSSGEKSIDDTGAGDAFVSGVLYGMLKNENLDTYLKMGVLNGGSVVGKFGAKLGLLDRKNMEKKKTKKVKMVEVVV